MDDDAESTFCPGCGALLIERHAYSIRHNRVWNGRCPDCGTPIEGVLLSAPTTARRVVR